jgi:hypothetical protein
LKAPLSKEAIDRLLGVSQRQATDRDNASRTLKQSSANAPENVQWRGDFDLWFKPTIPQETVDAIRSDRERGMKINMIAAKHNVSRGYVSRVCSNQVRKTNEIRIDKQGE